ncbi:hypothetical protein [Ureibacillus sp. GCM10028918]|uniref:hypothetical protein n=1 Tax=Ureibacillus sp. GCM10028918 TaxID=3273429 RepID=UPI0036106E6E
MEQILQAVLELSDKMDHQYHELNQKIDELSQKVDGNHAELLEKIKKVEVRIGILATEFNSIKADIFLIKEENNML